MDCGCIREVLTTDKTQLPAEQRWLDLVSAAPLPAGQLLCAHDEEGLGPYRAIVEWGRRREQSFPPDPAEPPDWTDADLWVKIRRDEPSTSAFWTVTLSCGHATDVVTDVNWKPEDGPRRVSEQRRLEMLANLDAHDVDVADDEAEDDHSDAWSRLAGRAQHLSSGAGTVRERGGSWRTNEQGGLCRAARRRHHRPRRANGSNSDCAAPRPKPTSYAPNSPSSTMPTRRRDPRHQPADEISTPGLTRATGAPASLVGSGWQRPTRLRCGRVAAQLATSTARPC